MADQNNAPERIWLQEAIGPEYDRTWCVEQQDDDDTLYIRADLALADRAAPEGQGYFGPMGIPHWSSALTPPPAAPKDNTALVEAAIRIVVEECYKDREVKLSRRIVERMEALSREAAPASQQEAMPVGCGQPCGYDCNGACFDPPACQQEAVAELIGNARLALDTGAISFGETADYRPEDIQAILDILDAALRALKGDNNV